MRLGERVVHVVDYWTIYPRPLREVLRRKDRIWEVLRHRRCIAFIRVANMDAFEERHGIHPKDMLYLSEEWRANDVDVGEEARLSPP